MRFIIANAMEEDNYNPDQEARACCLPILRVLKQEEFNFKASLVNIMTEKVKVTRGLEIWLSGRALA